MGFARFASFIAALSLLGSVTAAWFIIPSISPGFYGGTAVLIFLILIGQIIGLVVGVGLPMAVQAFRRRLQLSRSSRRLLIAATCGVLLEAAALYLIPVTGSS